VRRANTALVLLAALSLLLRAPELRAAGKGEPEEKAAEASAEHGGEEAEESAGEGEQANEGAEAAEGDGEAKAKGAEVEGAEAAPEAAPPGAEALAHELALRLLTLKQREDALLVREQTLAEVENEGQRIVDEVGALRAAIETRIAELAKGDAERIARIAKVYAAMPPANAGMLLEALPLDVSARVLAKMKQKNAAAILAAISSPSAVRISKNVLDPLQLGGAPPAAKEKP
jgi:flagellar motility protein MotE (MotC chaperone)